ncbi:MAG: hypothetical protein WCR21_13820, partial [Bacteroidota bacterium]
LNSFILIFTDCAAHSSQLVNISRSAMPLRVVRSSVAAQVLCIMIIDLKIIMYLYYNPQSNHQHFEKLFFQIFILPFLFRHFVFSKLDSL